jgi:hypothetical protein
MLRRRLVARSLRSKFVVFLLLEICIREMGFEIVPCAVDRCLVLPRLDLLFVELTSTHLVYRLVQDLFGSVGHSSIIGELDGVFDSFEVG